jgi:hydroxyethylthiazole kinase-like uncharacterized protein yjeF
MSRTYLSLPEINFMPFKEITIPQSEGLELERFKEMDYYAVENYALPIELMMENAGLQLANLIAHSAKYLNSKILIGVGNGNNGGGGLVAARRLAAWGYPVFIDLSTEISKDLPERQLERAVKFGASVDNIENPDIWVDAYLSFSQRLPLRPNLLDRISKANQSDCQRISLDIPTGFLGDTTLPYFQAHKVMTLAAPKKILYNLPNNTKVFIADLGIPKAVYERFGIKTPPFYNNNILKIK